MYFPKRSMVPTQIVLLKYSANYGVNTGTKTPFEK